MVFVTTLDGTFKVVCVMSESNAKLLLLLLNWVWIRTIRQHNVWTTTEDVELNEWLRLSGDNFMKLTDTTTGYFEESKI